LLKNKYHFSLMAFMILILGLMPLIFSCGCQEEQFFGEVLSVEEICSRIKYIRTGADLLLSYRFAPVLYRYALSTVYIFSSFFLHFLL